MAATTGLARQCASLFIQAKSLCTTPAWQPRIAIVGSGPAGFYAARSLRRLLTQANGGFIDIFDKCALPYGLVRFGVAPDHPEVKNCIRQFEDVFEGGNELVQCRYFGNVNIGADMSVGELRTRYDATLLAYGAPEAAQLDIPGAREGETPNYFTSKSFVDWYNGAIWGENETPVEPDLTSTDSVIILGHGNVALDIGRVLLTSVDKLRETDITQNALEKLMKSRIKRVTIVGRRGPLQVGFTIKEVREFINLPKVLSNLNPSDFGAISREIIDLLPRARKRLVKLLTEAAQMLRVTDSDDAKSWSIKFLRSPLEINKQPSTGHPKSVRFSVNDLKSMGDSGSILDLVPTPTGIEETLEAGLVISAIGYKSAPIDRDIPFDSERNVVLTDSVGRVGGSPGLYACGWCARGPTGVLATTQASAAAISRLIVSDLERDPILRKKREIDVEELLTQRSVQFITWPKWRKIDALEVERGDKVGKPREKIVHLSEILSLV